MKFRTIALIVTLAVGTLLAPLATHAQPAGKVPTLGYLSRSSAKAFSEMISHGPLLGALQQGLGKLGYTEGQNIAVQSRWAEGRQEQLADFAAELVRLKVNVIVTSGTPASLAAKRATTTIPIVMVGVGDPVGSGLVASLARPGGNITGLTLLATKLGGKRLELLREVVPRLRRVAVFWNPANLSVALLLRETEVGARALGVQLLSLEVRGPEDFEAAFAAAIRGRADALIALEDPLTVVHRGRIIDFATKNRLPATCGLKEFAQAGGLMSYGASLPDLYRRAATYVDKILKGAKPADLPVEQPTKFELVINLKTAKALGLTIPQSILLRADQVIR